MQIKRMIVLVVISILAVFMLTGCPPQPPPAGDHLSAKEFWDITQSEDNTLGIDAVPVYFFAMEGPARPIQEGTAYSWTAGFYSEAEKAIWETLYYFNIAQNSTGLDQQAAEKKYNDVSLTVSDLADWKIDSPEACEIAAQNGAGEVTLMTLRAARLGDLGNSSTYFYDPELVPESTKLFWVILANDFYYIDASTGEYLGSLTSEQIYDMRENQHAAQQGTPDG